MLYLHLLSFNLGFSWNETCPSIFARIFCEALPVQPRRHISCHEKPKLNDNNNKK